MVVADGRSAPHSHVSERSSPLLPLWVIDVDGAAIVVSLGRYRVPAHVLSPISHSLVQLSNSFRVPER